MGGGGKKARKRRAVALDALTADAGELDAATEALFDRLRARRKTLAEEQRVPPYVIFHDKTLAAMAVHRPLTPETFLQLGGVGQAKLDRYGEIFMEEIRQADAEV